VFSLHNDALCIYIYIFQNIKIVIKMFVFIRPWTTLLKQKIYKCEVVMKLCLAIVKGSFDFIIN
jgi:hypothetical protein